ncbi:hypothetical protein MBLNU230_g3497t1 [Neophaeotheca triangularis]
MSSDDTLNTPNATDSTTDVEIPPFKTEDLSKSPPAFHLPDQVWLTALSSTCSFKADVFEDIMLNLIKNPNITSSHLFRADILYDSDHDSGLPRTSDSPSSHALVDSLKPEYRPANVDAPGYTTQRAIVRQLIPRNPQLDDPLVQTCLFLTKHENGESTTVVVYIPHVQDPQAIPFYHPQVSRLAFTHRWRILAHDDIPKGTIAVSYNLFSGHQLNTKLQRTALRLLETLHKHGHGRLQGYEKRVHHDQIIGQKRYQDTYTRLKTRYAKQLADEWVEVTDPGKHVFEDLGIAAFLIEMWHDMYDCSSSDDNATPPQEDKQRFPGFVDIGCGNGVLSHILMSEGFQGSGFDARQRKTWDIFPAEIQSNLEAKLLVPEIFCSKEEKEDGWLGGIFPQGTFIISNHADELTAWTPLLAYLNKSPFIAIPCCSHDLAGARFRAPEHTKAAKQAQRTPEPRLPQQQQPDPASESELPSAPAAGDINNTTATTPPAKKPSSQAAETGSLKKSLAQKKVASAYSTLCSYVSSLAEEVGFVPEREILRIPSTRNTCIIGRKRAILEDSGGEGEGRGGGCGHDEVGLEARSSLVGELVERELGKSVDCVGREWIERARKLAKKPGSGH